MTEKILTYDELLVDYAAAMATALTGLAEEHNLGLGEVTSEIFEDPWTEQPNAASWQRLYDLATDIDEDAHDLSSLVAMDFVDGLSRQQIDALDREDPDAMREEIADAHEHALCLFADFYRGAFQAGEDYAGKFAEQQADRDDADHAKGANPFGMFGRIEMLCA